MLQKKQRQRRISINYLFFLIEISGLMLIGIIFYNFQYTTFTRSKYFIECDPENFAEASISPSDKLNDLNDLHLIQAERNGIKKPFTTIEDFYSKIDSLKRKSILIELTDNKFYQIKSLSHSEPYLIPEAVDMLNEIGFRFQKRLKEKKYNNYRFRITSLIRTLETQNNLSHHNRNASLHSAHLY